MNRNGLKERISALPVIDVHTHFETYTETFGYTMPQFFYFGSYLVCYSMYLTPEERMLMDDRQADGKRQFDILLLLKEKCRNTSTGRYLDKMASLIGIPLDKGSYDALVQWYSGRTRQSIVESTPTVRGYVANSPAHPLYGGLKDLPKFLDGSVKADPEIGRAVTVNELHCIRGREDLAVIAKIAGERIETLDDWEKAGRSIIRRAAKIPGVVTYKDLYLYFRPAVIGPCITRKQAAADFGSLMGGAQASQSLLDYMMYQVYAWIEESGLPVQIHTGGLMDTAMTASGISDLAQVILAYPKLRFDLLHLNYPLLETYEMVLKSCPNAYGDATWVFTSDPYYVRRYLDYALDMAPLDRTILFGSDRQCAGVPVAVALSEVQELLTDFFAERVSKGELSAGEAETISRMWLYENPNTLFKLF